MRSQLFEGQFRIRPGAMNRLFTSLVVVALTLVSSAAVALIGTSTASAQDYGPAKIWLTHWHPTPKCNGNVCTSTSIDDIPRFQVNGDHFDINGQVRIGFYRLNDRHLIKSYPLAATAHTGFPGGSFGKKADVIDCSLAKNTPANTYVQAYDYASGRWSNSITIRTGCAVL